MKSFGHSSLLASGELKEGCLYDLDFDHQTVSELTAVHALKATEFSIRVK